MEKGKEYRFALEVIAGLDPGLWKVSRDIAREVLGYQPRWRGKAKRGGIFQEYWKKWENSRKGRC